MVAAVDATAYHGSNWRFHTTFQKVNLGLDSMGPCTPLLLLHMPSLHNHDVLAEYHCCKNELPNELKKKGEVSFYPT